MIQSPQTWSHLKSMWGNVYVSFISATFCPCDWTCHFLLIGFSFPNSRKDSWAEWCQRPLPVSLFLQAWCFSIPKKIWEERKYTKNYKEKINLCFGEEYHLCFNNGTMLFSLKLIRYIILPIWAHTLPEQPCCPRAGTGLVVPDSSLPCLLLCKEKKQSPKGSLFLRLFLKAA